MKAGKRTVFALATIVGGMGAFAGTGTQNDPVTTVEELTNALWTARGTKAVIYVQPGFYDVSNIHMKHNNAKSGGEESDPVSHIALDNVYLYGNTTDPRAVVIYGNKSDRIIYCWQSSVKNLTISNGCAKAGCLYDGGGGLCGRNAVTQAENIIVTECSAPLGGGIRTVKCTNVTVENCTATSNGGGVYASADNPRFYNGVIRNCTAGGNGGGVCGYADVSNTVISACQASLTAGYGGGACGPSGSNNKCTIRNCTLYGNSAYSGGGAGIGSAVFGGVVSNNVAVSTAGGIYGGNSSESSSASDVLVCGNRAGGNAGGVFNLSADNCRIVGNTSEQSGGGGYSAVFTGGVVSNNIALIHGGGAYGGKAYDAYIGFNLLSNNCTGTASKGAGVYGSSCVSNCTIAGNAIVDHAVNVGSGGAGRDTTFVACRIFDNYAALGATAEASSFLGCLISNNVASAKYKHYTLRNIQCLDGCDVCGELIDTPRRVVNTKYHGCRSSWMLPEGANVYTSGTFVANNSYLIYSSQGTGLCFTNCLFCDNRASSSLVYRPEGASAVPVVNCTFAGNQTAYTLVGFNETHPCEIANSIFAENMLYDGMTPRALRYAQGDNITLENCLVGTSSQADVEALASHPNTIVSDAVRFDSENAEHPYSIKRTSAARRNGKVMDWMASATDIRRDPQYPRKRDGEVDIGCYECWLDPVGMMLLFR